MKYLCLIYDDEQQWQKFPKEVQDKYMGEYGAFTESIKKSGKFVGANQLQPTQTATTVRARYGKVSTTDGPFRAWRTNHRTAADERPKNHRPGSTFARIFERPIGPKKGTKGRRIGGSVVASPSISGKLTIIGSNWRMLAPV